MLLLALVLLIVIIIIITLQPLREMRHMHATRGLYEQLASMQMQQYQ